MASETYQCPHGSRETVTVAGSSVAGSMSGHDHTNASGAVVLASRSAPPRAGGQETFHVAGRAGPEPGQLLRLATIACASTRGSVRPIVCAAHLDQLPARAPQVMATAAGGRPAGYVQPLAVTLVLAVAAAACGRWLVLRRRARGAP